MSEEFSDLDLVELCDALHDNAHKRLVDAAYSYSPYKRFIDVLDVIPKMLQRLYLLYAVDGSYENGGLVHFFIVEGMEAGLPAIEAFNFLNAPRRANILEQAYLILSNDDDWDEYVDHFSLDDEYEIARKTEDPYQEIFRHYQTDPSTFA